MRTSPLTEAEVDRGLLAVFRFAEQVRERVVNGPVAAAVEPGSSLAGDNRVSKPYHVAHGVVAGIGTATEHMDAVRALVMDAKVLHPAAPFTLTRAAIEAASAAVWLLRPRSRPERVVRRIRQLVRDAKDGDRAAGELGVTGRPLNERLTDLESIARRATGDSALKIKPSETTEIVKDADEAVGSTLLVLTAWRVCAGFSHGRLWTTLSVLDRDVLESDEPGVMDVHFTNSKDRLLWALMAAKRVTEEAVRLYDERRTRHR